MISILKMNRYYYLFLLITSFLIGQEKTYRINGEASFANGLMVGDAAVMLLDTTEKVIQASGINYQQRGKSLWLSAPETSNVIIEFSETAAGI